MQTDRIEIVVAIPMAVEHIDFEINTFCEAVVVAANKIVETLLLPVR